MTDIRVLVVDDHAIAGVGVQTLVRSQPDLQLCGYAACGELAVELAQSLAPDVILMDLSMPGIGGIAATAAILASAAGACGYLLKDADHHVLVEAIRMAARGECPMSPMVMQALCS